MNILKLYFMKNSLEKIKDADKQKCLVRQFKVIIASYLWFTFLKKSTSGLYINTSASHISCFLLFLGLSLECFRKSRGETLKFLLQQGEGLLSSTGVHTNNHTSTEVSFLICNCQ